MTDKNEDMLLKNFIIIKKIGHGSFGEVYIATNKDNQYFAAKVEEKTNALMEKSKQNKERIEIEYRIYKRLYHRGFISGIPNVYNFMQTDKCNIMIMELLGPNLDELFNKFGKKFKLETIILLAEQLIDLISSLHKTRYIHRDIKPNNFLIGLGDRSSKLFIMDFGLSKQYMDKDNKHMEYTQGRSLIGTARYASTNMHLGIEPSRRDDVTSIGYMLIYFAKGKLNWQGIKKSDHSEQLKAIGQLKLTLGDVELCENLPECFIKYIQYCRTLKFDDEPDYKYLKTLFTEQREKMNIPDDYKFEWNLAPSA